MKGVIKPIAEGIGRGFSLVFPSVLFKLVNAFGVHIYTGYYARRFKHWGKCSILGYPLERTNRLDLVSIGDDCEIDKHTVLTVFPQGNGEPEIKIGNGCHIGAYAHLTATRGITIGDNLLTGTNIIITDNAHGATDTIEALQCAPSSRPLLSKGEVIIGNNVWLANNVCILPGVIIGDGVVVAANSCVTHDLPDYCVAAGCPAKIIKKIN